MSQVANKMLSLLSRSAPSDEAGIRRVAVIGAGPLGVSAAKYLAGENKFDAIDVFEQQSSFGGAWIWSQPGPADAPIVPQTNPFGPLDKIRPDKNGVKVLTPMYDKLETNIPHILMRFSEKPFSPDDLLFPSRTTVLKYIEEYSQEVEHLVKFGHQVTHVDLARTTGGADKWTLRYKNLESGQEAEEKYDAIAVANGHYAHTSIPSTPGISEWKAAYPGSVQHSKFYRRADDYAGKKVVIVGNASSGIDIGSQIAGKCQKPLIMAARSEPLFKMPAYAEHINKADVVAFVNPKLGNRAVKFADGSIEENIDVVLFATGYFLSFPFLEPSIQRTLVNSGSMVHGTYQHLFWIDHPSLAFLGLPNKVLPLPLGEAQAVALARVWSGRLALPTKPLMRIWEHQRWKQAAEMLAAKGKPTEAIHVEKAFLSMGPGQDMAYHNELIRWAGDAAPGSGRPLPHAWDDEEMWIRSQMAPMKKAWAELDEQQKAAVRTIEDIGIDYQKFKAEQKAAESTKSS